MTPSSHSIGIRISEGHRWPLLAEAFEGWPDWNPLDRIIAALDHYWSHSRRATVWNRLSDREQALVADDVLERLRQLASKLGRKFSDLLFEVEQQLWSAASKGSYVAVWTVKLIRSALRSAEVILRNKLLQIKTRFYFLLVVLE